MQQTFEIFLELHKRSEVGGLGHIAPDHGTNLVGLGDQADPGIFLHLLQPKSDTLSLLIDLENHCVDRIALLEHFTRVYHLAGP